MDAQPLSTDAPVCPGCLARDRRITQLEARMAALEAKLEALARGAKRQAAPFSKGAPVAQPKRPGRKGGDDYGVKAFRAVPPRIDETHEAPLPPRCPDCGGPVALAHTAAQYQAEIPRRPIYRRFNVAVGRCTCCRRRVQGRHPLQTSDALGCCASQVGPEAQAAVVMMNKELGLSQGKIGRFFQSFFGIKLSRGGSCQIMLRAAARLEENYQTIVQHVRTSPWIVPDETGWRLGGSPAWLHVAVGQGAAAYLVHRRRGAEASALLIGADYAGTLIHDGWAPYGHFAWAIHQTCLGHLLARCKELLETATGGAVLFPRRVKALLQESLALRDRRDAGALQPATAARRAGALERRMEALVMPPKTHAGHERLANHLATHQTELFVFLKFPGIDATNWRAEQAIRPAVVNRKVWGGNRTEAGAQAQGVLLSVLATARLAKVEAVAFIAQVLRALPGRRPLLLSPASG
ncbi:MAG: IS66 family transposase [Phycisphaeraceae bacterium]